MPWGWFAVGLVVTLLAQTTVLPFVAADWLDLFMVYALVVALAAPVPDARLAGWLIGFVQDIESVGPLGLHALALGLLCVGVTYLRGGINLQLWWGRWLIGLIVALPVQYFRQLPITFTTGAWGHAFVQALTTALVSAFLAAVLTELPNRFSPRRRRVYLR